jgi:hypothetical protein
VAGSIFDGATMALICEVARKEIVETPQTSSSETESWLNFTGSLGDQQRWSISLHHVIADDCS